MWKFQIQGEDIVGDVMFGITEDIYCVALLKYANKTGVEVIISFACSII